MYMSLPSGTQGRHLGPLRAYPEGKEGLPCIAFAQAWIISLRYGGG
jgi:hypothetical protein